MPEGDTIHRLAVAIRGELLDRSLRDARLRDRGTLDTLLGRRVARVSARGKHLMIDVEGGWSLRTHLGMYGDVHRYRRGVRWKRSENGAVLLLRTVETELVWFEPAQADLYPTRLLDAHPALGRLGPDLVAPEVDLSFVVDRAAECARLRGRRYTVSELLLDQAVACGMGNIYKSEVLFLEGVHPRTPASSLDSATLLALYTRAHHLLRQNLRLGKRATRRGSGRGGAFVGREPRLWVYGREGQRCLRCGGAITMGEVGAQRRVTFWCARCQPADGSARDGARV